MRWKACLVVAAIGVFFPVASGWADSTDSPLMGVRSAVSGQIVKIESGLLFVKTPYGLQFRTISPNKADRVGLHNARLGGY